MLSSNRSLRNSLRWLESDNKFYFLKHQNIENSDLKGGINMKSIKLTER